MDNNLRPEIIRRKGAAWAAYNTIKPAVSQMKNSKLKAELFNATVTPALCYGSLLNSEETCTLFDSTEGLWVQSGPERIADAVIVNTRLALCCLGQSSYTVMDKDNVEDLPRTLGQTALPERFVGLLSKGDISAIIAAIRVEQQNPCSSKSQPTPSTSFTRKGFASQFEFNGSIITKLSSINKSCIPKEVEDIIQSVVDTLKTRNETLEIADEHPGVFAFLDNKRQADEIKSSDPHLAEYLEQIGKEQKANKRKRASSPQLRQPFPALSCKGVSVAPWHPKIQPPSQILLFFTTLERPVWLCASLI
ncbi:hypothetical protein ANCCEY_08234 [Ancylostoma ceylanicum]|uniref:Uncharacterized protein n=1 Tax=Ancylostoma ceylanicum TaxID=53326 RepID=A0A0D6LRL8_9BILA|nr:hypothetical protein ANCCEY_08234 [Ancylostoma ceylanicum]